jgi:hypothetical protein
MRRGIKKQDHEKLSNENISRVRNLLESDKPITKKEACGMLNISYNTSRLAKIIEEYADRQMYVEKRKNMNRGKKATDAEISEAVARFLAGDPISDISRGLYRSTGFVNNIIEKVGVPARIIGKENQLKLDFIPDECVSDDFEKGEVVWSAKYHAAARIRQQLSPEYVSNAKGMMNTNYEEIYGCKCYAISVIERVDSDDSLFPAVQHGGFAAYAPAYELGKLKHLEQYGVDLSRL